MKVTIDTTELNVCSIKGCNNQPLYRHHKGCDHFIGQFILRVRVEYKLYLDCCNVCDKHHEWIHYAYGPVIKGWLDWTPNGVMKLRTTLIALCDDIIAGKVRLKRPTKLFHRKWKARRRAWLKRLEAKRKR